MEICWSGIKLRLFENHSMCLGCEIVQHRFEEQRSVGDTAGICVP